MDSDFFSSFNPFLNQGLDWVEHISDLEEPETVRGFTTSRRRLTIAELPEWAEEIWQTYAGEEDSYLEDREAFEEWIGENATAVADKIEWKTSDEYKDE
jgi:hypothetical protein